MNTKLTLAIITKTYRGPCLTCAKTLGNLGNQAGGPGRAMSGTVWPVCHHWQARWRLCEAVAALHPTRAHNATRATLHAPVVGLCVGTHPRAAGTNDTDHSKSRQTSDVHHIKHTSAFMGSRYRSGNSELMHSEERQARQKSTPTVAQHPREATHLVMLGLLRRLLGWDGRAPQ
jgi:hypothetical protein